VREYDLDGLYHDCSGAAASTNQLAGCGYIRDGKVRATYPYFSTREIYKRIYTMMKQYGKEKGKDMFMMAHMSSQLPITMLSFCDAILDGEQFAGGRVKDNYLDLVTLDCLRSEFMGSNYGVMPFFLPEIPVQLKKITKELIGYVGLLHNIEFWPIWDDVSEMNRVYKVFDNFGGFADAEFIPYWNNGNIIKGQSDTLKCSAYRKPGGGSLVCAVNMAKQDDTVTLEIDWDKLKSSGELSVTDAISKETIPVQGKNITVGIKALNFKIFWVK
jgi:hypothetical protein